MATRMNLERRALVAVRSTMGVSSSHDALVAGESLADALDATDSAFPAAWVDVVYNLARRCGKWTAHY